MKLVMETRFTLSRDEKYVYVSFSFQNFCKFFGDPTVGAKEIFTAKNISSKVEKKTMEVNWKLFLLYRTSGFIWFRVNQLSTSFEAMNRPGTEILRTAIIDSLCQQDKLSIWTRFTSRLYWIVTRTVRYWLLKTYFSLQTTHPCGEMYHFNSFEWFPC